MRKVCEMCGGTGQRPACFTSVQTTTLSSEQCPMCGGQGYVEDMVYDEPQKTKNFTAGYRVGYSAGYNEGRSSVLEQLVKNETLSVKPIFLCRKCGKELGFIKDGE